MDINVKVSKETTKNVVKIYSNLEKVRRKWRTVKGSENKNKIVNNTCTNTKRNKTSKLSL